jgi:hypothetical protein
MTSYGAKNLEDWRAWTGGDENSYFENPYFIDNDDLQLQSQSIAITNGVPLDEVQTDIFETLRHITNPTIGAYEYEMIQASDLQFAYPVKPFGMVFIIWTKGSGHRTALFMKNDDVLPEKPQPENGVTYQANQFFGNGDQIGTSGWYCVFNNIYDIYSMIEVNGPDYNTYTFMAVDYFGTDGNEFYILDEAYNNPASSFLSGGAVNEINSNLTVFPNPSSGIVNFSLINENSISEITIFDNTGKSLNNLCEITENQINITNLNDGIYYIKIQTENNIFQQKILLIK